jgi:hypothetical protein
MVAEVPVEHGQYDFVVPSDMGCGSRFENVLEEILIRKR